MPELNGIEATRRVVAAAPHIRVIALSMHRIASTCVKSCAPGRVDTC
jgi:DNA-binding NarL/FixJ family response regulator